MRYQRIKEGFWCKDGVPAHLYIDPRSVEIVRAFQHPKSSHCKAACWIVLPCLCYKWYCHLPCSLVQAVTRLDRERGMKEKKTWLKPIHLTRQRYCSPFKFCFCMWTILLHVSSIWPLFTSTKIGQVYYMVGSFWFIHLSSSIIAI